MVAAPIALHWHVGFVDLDSSGHWVRRLLMRLRPPRHVVCFADTPAGLLSIQQTLEGLRVAVQPGATALGFTAEIVGDGGSVFPVAVPELGTVGWRPRPFSCVCLARSLLTLPHKVQTPRGLASELSRGYASRTGGPR